MNNLKYPELIKALRRMNEKQLVALFQDFEDIEAVNRISDAAYKVSEEYIAPEECDLECEHSEWTQDDNARRNREWLSDYER